MAKKPSYIGLLNTIANAERGGYELFQAWGGSTKDEDLKVTLDMVAVREMEHSWAFEKRLTELGFTLQPSRSKQLNKQVRFLKSTASDEDKFASLGVATEKSKDDYDTLLQVLADQSIDPQTGALMGRFIAEERDSGRQLQKAYKSIFGRKKNKKNKLRKTG